MLIKKIKEESLKIVYEKIKKRIKRKFTSKIMEIKIEKMKFKEANYCFEEFIPKLNFFYDSSQKVKIIEKYNLAPEKKKNVIKEAQDILEHKFDLLGSGVVDLKDQIPWNEDFKEKFIWENMFYKKIKTVDLNNNADVKVPWELSRFQHLFCLGKAYWITGDKKYYMEFKEQILDWIDKNPYCMSVNWACAMDVSIRAINWIHAYFHFSDLIEKDLEFKNVFNNILYQHGKFIIRNLEKGIPFSNNHYLSDLSGLIYLGFYFKDLKNGLKEHKKWLKVGLSEFEQEMFIQNNEDGTNYETSTSYHRLVVELFLYSTILAEKNGIKFSGKYNARLEKMHNFLLDITKPNGSSPLIGDVDNGRVLILSNYYDWDKSDLNNTLGIAGVYFNRWDLKYLGKKYFEELIWIMGDKTEDSFLRKKIEVKSTSYKNGGFYILKNKNIYCIIRCGELSLRGRGGHSHNDQLSIELNVKGKDFFIDPGVDVYTANYISRNKFRSTEMHNTVSIVGHEQNNFNKKDLFVMKEQTFARCIKFNQTKFIGEHKGYKDKLNTLHQREITIEENFLEIEDTLKSCEGIANFILDENVEIIGERGQKLKLKNEDVVLEILNISGYNVKTELRSKGYGSTIKTKKIEIRFNSKNKIILKIKSR